MIAELLWNLYALGTVLAAVALAAADIAPCCAITDPLALLVEAALWPVVGGLAAIIHEQEHQR